MPRGAIDRRSTSLLVALALVAAVKGALFWIDGAPIFFFGDSESYLYAAVADLGAAHRSYLYAAMIRALAVPAGSLTWLMVAQALAATATAWLLVLTLVRQLGVAPGIGIAAGLALALDPMQLLAERMVLPETFALLAFAVWTMVVFRYLRRPTIAALATSCLLGIVLVAFRVVFVPVVIGTTAVVPLLAARADHVGRAGATPTRRRLGHLALAAAVTALLHLGYRALVFEITGFARTYIAGDGFWTASAWAPVLEPDDATDRRAATVIAALPTDGPRSRRSMYNRDHERWDPDGMVSRLVQAFDGDARAANEAARALAFHALRRDPVGVARLACRTYLGFFGIGWNVRDHVLDDEGMLRGFTPSRSDVVRDRLGIDTGEEAQRHWTPVRRWHYAGRVWYPVLALAPLVLLAALAVSPSWRRPLVLSVLVATTALLVAICCGANGPVQRYLHPYGYTCVLGLALLADRCLPAAARRR